MVLVGQCKTRQKKRHKKCAVVEKKKTDSHSDRTSEENLLMLAIVAMSFNIFYGTMIIILAEKKDGQELYTVFETILSICTTEAFFDRFFSICRTNI